MKMQQETKQEWEMQLEQQLRHEEDLEEVRKGYIDQVCERVRAYAIDHIQKNTSPRPTALVQRLKKNVQEDQLNAEALSQIILHVLDSTSKQIHQLMDQPLTQVEYMTQMRREIEQELHSLFLDNKPVNIIAGDPIAAECKAIYRQSNGMDTLYEDLLNAGVIAEPLELKHLDAIAAMHNRRVIRSKKAFELANGIKDSQKDPENQTANQVFVEDFAVDRPMIEEGLRNAERPEKNLPMIVGQVVRSPDGTLLGFAIFLVIPENCVEKSLLYALINKGYSESKLRYYDEEDGVSKKKNELLKAAKEGKPFVILAEVGGERKRAATMAKSGGYREIQERRLLKNNKFIGLAYWQRGLVMKWIEGDGSERLLFQGIEDLPGKNTGGEIITQKFEMGNAGPYGRDANINNEGKRKAFPTENGETLVITTEWANVSGMGEDIMAAAEKHRPPTSHLLNEEITLT